VNSNLNCFIISVLHHGGFVSNSDFSFWKNLLEMFPKGHPRFSMQHEIQQLQLTSSTLDLHTRRSHLTVEVSSASERETALGLFMSESFSQSLRVLVVVRDKKEREKMECIERNFVWVVCRGADGGTNLGHLIYLIAEPGKKCHNDQQALIYLRPPIVHTKKPRGDSHSPNTTAALCALSLHSAQNSLMLINESEEKAAFRAFEKKFMHSDETGFLIYDVASLRYVYDKVSTEEKIIDTAVDLIKLPPGIDRVKQPLIAMEENFVNLVKDIERRKNEVHEMEKIVAEDEESGMMNQKMKGHYKKAVNKMIKEMTVKIEAAEATKEKRRKTIEQLSLELIENTSSTVLEESTVSAETTAVPQMMMKMPQMMMKIWKVKTYCIDHKNTVSIKEKRNEER
ncbi:hypothetical protein PENTCL1PPCAC_7382, partial [Pristionchus entomophagus]